MSCVFPEVWILRHGQTEWNVAGKLQGQHDSPLTPVGIGQAKAQAKILKRVLPGPVPVFASDAGRAQHTARIAAEGRSITTDAALAEIGIGDWQGQTVEQIKQMHPDLKHREDLHLWKFAAPGGESLYQMVARVDQFLEQVTEPSVIVTHGVTSRLLRCLILGLPPENLSQLPGGQGVVHHLRNGQAEILYE